MRVVCENTKGADQRKITVSFTVFQQLSDEDILDVLENAIGHQEREEGWAGIFNFEVKEN